MADNGGKALLALTLLVGLGAIIYGVTREKKEEEVKPPEVVKLHISVSAERA